MIGFLLRRLAPVAIFVPVLATQDARNAVLLTRDHPVDREISGAEMHVYALALDAGEYARLTVEQRGIDVVVQIEDSGALIAEFDAESRKQGCEPVVLAAGRAGTYQLRVRPRYVKQPAGRYEIRVEEIRPATDGDRIVFDSYRLGSEASRLAELGKLDDAIQTGERALALREKASLAKDSYPGYLLTQIAEAKRVKGDYAGAEQGFQRAIAVDEETLGREHPQTALALRGLGQLYMMTSAFAKAEPLLRQHLDILEKALGHEHPTVAYGLRLFALLHEYLNDLERSRVEFEQALAIALKKCGPQDLELIAITNDLGNLYVTLEDYDRAQPLLERALELAERKFGRDYYRNASPLRNLASIAFDKRDYPRALELLARALALREKVLGARHPDVAGIRNEVADVYQEMGDYRKSIETRERALGILNEVASPYDRLFRLVFEGFADSYAALGDAARALDYQKRSQEAFEKNIALNLAAGSEKVKLEYLRQASWSTDRTISLQTRLAPDDPGARELAALVLLQRKGRVLDALSGSIAALRQRMSGDDSTLLDQLGELHSRLAKVALAGPGGEPAAEYRKQLAALEEQSERLEATIGARSAEFCAQSLPVSLAAIEESIPPGAALLEFSAYHPFDPKLRRVDAYGELHYIVYVLRRQGEVQWAELGPVKEIDQAAAAMRLALRDSRRSDVAQVARALDRRVMQPVRRLIGDARQLLVSPDGALNLVPFEALVDEQGNYLLERYSITYLSSGRDLLRMQLPLESKNRPVVIADPFFGEPRIPSAAVDRTVAGVRRRSVTTGADLSTVYFAPLEATGAEGRAIRSLFPDADLITGRQATKAALTRLESPRILHIATHGFFLDDAPKSQAGGTRAISARANVENPLLRAGLALAGANLNRSGSDQGILTALEASNLNLWGTKVVTLSACETGVGEVKNGEGIYGLRRAFFLAGAETLVMSLWPVSDSVTRELMTAYYSGLKDGLGRGAALRHAQLAMVKRKERQHPYFWASFIQAGNWKSLDGQ